MTENRRIIAIDVGTKAEGSGYVDFQTCATAKHLVGTENTKIVACGIFPNTQIEELLLQPSTVSELVFEMISSQGNRQGRDIHRTLMWISRLATCRRTRDWRSPAAFVLARTAAAWMAESKKAGDPQVAQAVRDRFGGMGATPSQVKGTAKNPGPLYGFKGDVWRAMATGIAFVEGAKQEHPWEPR